MRLYILQKNKLTHSYKMYNAINFVLEEQELHLLIGQNFSPLASCLMKLFTGWWPLYQFQGKVLPIPADARLIASLVG